jgi:hypothetical protein
MFRELGHLFKSPSSTVSVICLCHEGKHITLTDTYFMFYTVILLSCVEYRLTITII